MGTPIRSNSPNLDFLPINQPHSPPESKVRRAYLSCERCRKRKSRCEPLQGRYQPCKRCVGDNQTCEFRNTRSTKRRASRQDVSPSLERRQSHAQGRQESESSWMSLSGPNPSPGTNVSILPEEEVAPSTAHEAVPPKESERSDIPALDARARLVSTHLHNTADALDLLTFAATGSQAQNNPSVSSVDGGQLHQPEASPVTASVLNVPANQARRVSPWPKFILIRKGVVSQDEVIEYLDFFFKVLWPLKPVLPSYYRERSRYALLAAEEPLLLTCLVTLASRYHPLSGSHGEIRSERIHWQAWKFLQRFLQSVMWGSTTTRSLGAIAAMLLLIDWHVKAINNTMDFTEGDSDAMSGTDETTTSYGAQSNEFSSLTGQRRYGMTSLMENLNIVAPAYRSNKMSWILLSNAIALAHEGCCFDHEAHSPVVSLSEAESVRQEWSRLVCVFIYLADEGLATRLGLEPLLPEKSRQVVRDRFSTTFADSLPDSLLWEGYFELFVEARKGREFLHSLKRNGASLLTLNMVPDLEHLSRALSRWKRQYHHRHDSSTFVSACLDMEFYYIVMYSFAPAAQALQSCSESTNQKKEALSRFAEQAAQASHDLLTVLVNILQPEQLVAYLPVRCWLFIVAASLHLLKVTLTKNQLITDSDPNIGLLWSVIRAIHDGSPDDSHMAMRFSKFLGIVLQASLQTSSGSKATLGGASSDSDQRTMPLGEDMANRAFTSVILQDVDTWEIPFNFDLASDPWTWWDAPLGRDGFSRFP